MIPPTSLVVTIQMTHRLSFAVNVMVFGRVRHTSTIRKGSTRFGLASPPTDLQLIGSMLLLAHPFLVGPLHVARSSSWKTLTNAQTIRSTRSLSHALFPSRTAYFSTRGHPCAICHRETSFRTEQYRPCSWFLCNSCASRPFSYVVGNIAALGQGNTEKAVPLINADAPSQSVSISVPRSQLESGIEYRFIIKDKKGNVVADEDGARSLRVSSEMLAPQKAGTAQVVMGYVNSTFRYSRKWRGAGLVIPVFSIPSDTSCGVGEYN